MGRLFWKFFFIFWLAQMLTAVCVGVLMDQLHHHGHHDALLAGPGGARWADGQPPPAPYVAGGTAPQPPWVGAAGSPPPPFPQPPGPDRGPSLPLIPIAAGGVVSMVFAALMAAQFARPIRKLRAAFDGLASGQLDTRVVADRGWLREELESLGGDFNEMAARLQGMVVAQKRLLHDVSHELRSPLARLQAAADLIHQQPARGPEFATRMLRETSRMDALVGEILTLARLDADVAQRKQAYQRICMDGLVQDALDGARMSADAAHCQLRNAVAPGVSVDGHGEYLLRALDNVVGNAVKHSPPGGMVELTSYRQGAHWVIVCSDEGSGVFDGDLARIFEPFYRSASAHGKDGYGLGLAIAKRVFESHGGSISASNRPQRGMAVHMALPAVD